MVRVKTHRVWILAIVVALAVGVTASAQGRRWVMLGDARVDGRADHDSIRVGGSSGMFRAIQLRVNGGTVNFDRVVVRYGNRTQEVLPVRARIRSGGETRAIDLPGDRRVIESVELWYSKDNWRTRPRVSLYGLR